MRGSRLENGKSSSSPACQSVIFVDINANFIEQKSVTEHAGSQSKFPLRESAAWIDDGGGAGGGCVSFQWPSISHLAQSALSSDYSTVRSLRHRLHKSGLTGAGAGSEAASAVFT
ncbi:hypothetical protein INR49_000611 [Caranx melampygus]|nr:hypothetical protein INR49_000611 [Caranx melampygus]